MCMPQGSHGAVVSETGYTGRALGGAGPVVYYMGRERRRWLARLHNPLLVGGETLRSSS